MINKPGENKTSTSLSPSQTAELLKQLYEIKFKRMPDGSTQPDLQVINTINSIEKTASKAFGKEWDSIYAKYSAGMGALEKVSDLVNLNPNATASDLNLQIEKISKLSETPAGKLLLQQSVDEFKTSTRIDLSDSIKAIQQMIDVDKQKTTLLQKIRKLLN